MPHTRRATHPPVVLPAPQPAAQRSPRLTRALLALLILPLAGCATLNKDECLTANWAQLGLQDGRAGQPASWINEHREACAKHGVVPNEPAWQGGRLQGLVDYCVPDRAVSDGLAGRGYQGVCPVWIDADFGRLNRAALQVHSARGTVQSLNSQAAQLDQEFLNKATTEQRRAAIRQEQRALDRRQIEARDELRWRERDLDRLRQDLRRGG